MRLQCEHGTQLAATPCAQEPHKMVQSLRRLQEREGSQSQVFDAGKSEGLGRDSGHGGGTQAKTRYYVVPVAN